MMLVVFKQVPLLVERVKLVKNDVFSGAFSFLIVFKLFLSNAGTIGQLWGYYG